MTFLDNKLQGQSSAPDPWVFLIDVGPVHISYAFRSALPKHIHLCYINPSSTSVAQPADVGAGHCMRQLLCDHSAVRKSTSTAGGTSWLPGAGQSQPTHGGGHTFPQRQTWTISRRRPTRQGASAISILEEHADEDDAEREVQEEEGDEADQAIPEDEQPTRPQLTRAQRLLALRLAHGNLPQSDLQTARHPP